MADIKTVHQKATERKIALIDTDIALIETALSSDDEDKVRDVHITIDGKYQSCIKGWALGLYAYDLTHGCVYDHLDIESLKDNLRRMKPKLESYKEGWNALSTDSEKASGDVSVVVNNTINIDISFEQAREKIENMPGLTDAQTEEIKSKIDDLESISKDSSISKKKKWEKVKPIISFAIDKGADVAIAIMTLVLQMKLGM